MFVLFREVQKVLDGLLVSEFENNEALALAWYDYLEGTHVGDDGEKSQFYNKVVENTEKVCRHNHINCIRDCLMKYLGLFRTSVENRKGH
jgi:hypothetical protein